jgi:hypothetical protein
MAEDIRLQYNEYLSLERNLPVEWSSKLPAMRLDMVGPHLWSLKAQRLTSVLS